MDGASQYRLEKVSFAAAYGAERVRAFPFLPRNVRPPYQVAVWYGGSPFIVPGPFSIYTETTWFLFLVRSGRAVMLPEYKGSFERRIRSKLFLGRLLESAAWRELIIHSALDLERTIDYLATRDDIDAGKIAYYGLSLGAAAGGIMTAVEPRFRASILLGGGLYPWNRPPEVDIFNFLPRVRVPTLMINGEHDTFFNVEGSQKPMFHWIGAKEKACLRLPSGHIPSERDQWVGAILDWLDRYLGPVTVLHSTETPASSRGPNWR
jgi:pimeloyl-ACP methyl ester carboxylesterase